MRRDASHRHCGDASVTLTSPARASRRHRAWHRLALGAWPVAVVLTGTAVSLQDLPAQTRVFAASGYAGRSTVVNRAKGTITARPASS